MWATVLDDAPVGSNANIMKPSVGTWQVVDGAAVETGQQ